MDNDVAFFLAIVAFLVLYLVFSALTDLVLKSASNQGILKRRKGYSSTDTGFYGFDSSYSTHDSGGSSDCGGDYSGGGDCGGGDAGGGCDGGF